MFTFKEVAPGNNMVYDEGVVVANCTTPELAERVCLLLNKYGGTLGFGRCPDCVWKDQPEGCNVPRDSEACLRNRVLKDTP